MTISAQVDFKDMYDTLDKLERGAMWQYIGQKIKARVKQLMNQGIDVDGKKYKAYSKQYSKWKVVKKGLSPNPNLQLKSNMWKSIQARHTVTFFEIYLTGKAANDKALWNMSSRNFFSWGSELYKVLNKAVDEYLRLEGF